MKTSIKVYITVPC